MKYKKIAVYFIFLVALLVGCVSSKGSNTTQEQSSVVSSDTSSQATEIATSISDNEQLTTTDETLWVTAQLNVRAGNGTEYEVLGVLNYGDSVLRTGVCNNGWSRITYKGEEAYVNSSYLQYDEIVSETKSETMADTTNKNEQQVVYSGNIYLEGGASTDLAFKGEAQLNYLPSSLVNHFFDSGCKLVISGYDLATTYLTSADYGSISGLFYLVGEATSPTIYIQSTEHAVDYSLLHEFGHYFDYLNDWTSTSEDFIAIYNEEKSTFTDVLGDTSYHTSDSNEYFAQSFLEYFRYPNILRESAPKTFYYLQDLLSKQ